MKLALYKNTQYNFVNAHEMCEWMEKQTDMVRISEPVDVEFPPRANDEVVALQVVQLEAAAKEIEAKAYDAVQNIKARIRELQCLPAPESAQ